MGRSILIAMAFALGSLPSLKAQEADEATPALPSRTVLKQPAEIGSGIRDDARPIVTANRQSIRDAYTLSRTATTVDEYAEILRLCDQGLVGQQDAATRAYIKQLQAWAANRRGEAYSQEAAELSSAGKLEKATARDAQALADFDTAVLADPTKWKSVHNRGVSYALAGRYEEALQDLTKAIELNGTYVNTWFNRAEVRYELGQYEDAANDYSEVIDRQPDDFGAYTGRGHAYYRMGEFNKALADYSRAVALDANSAGALVNRGDTYRQLGRWTNASADYRAALKVDETYGRAYRAAAWLMATCPDERFRNPDLALRAAEKAIELDGAEDYLYHDTLAAALAALGKYSEAITAAEQAFEAAPDEARLGVEERLTLYRGGKPYRLSTHVATRPTPARR
jgi:tetratricopeptide (TPR) repeat protein